MAAPSVFRFDLLHRRNIPKAAIDETAVDGAQSAANYVRF
jgi:hypothetical protein